jgi:endonuclease-3
MAETKDGNKVEKQLMQVLPKNIWVEIEMAISFLGREICRPTNPKCESCPIIQFCHHNQKTTNQNKANYKKPKQSVFRILATTK